MFLKCVYRERRIGSVDYLLHDTRPQSVPVFTTAGCVFTYEPVIHGDKTTNCLYMQNKCKHSSIGQW